MKSEQTNTDKQNLLTALRALAREEDGLTASPRVEAEVMRAWDAAQTRRLPWRHPFAKSAFGIAAALVAALSVTTYWWTPDNTAQQSRQPPLEQPAVATSWPSSDALAWLDPDPSSLQIVHVRVASATLAAQGYVVSDPDGDGIVDIQMIVGPDGSARSVRVAPSTTVIY